MAKEIEINLGKKSYRLQAEEGQDTRVLRVADMWDNYIKNLMASAPNMERDQVIILAGMMMADEFLTLKQEVEVSKKSLDAMHNSLTKRIENLISSTSGK